MPSQGVAAKVHKELGGGEGVGARVTERGPDFLDVEFGVVGSGLVLGEPDVEVFLFAGGEPFGRPGGFGVVGEDKVDDEGEEDGEDSFEEVD